MFEFNVNLDLDFTIPQTDRAAEVIRRFGLRETRIREQRLRHGCRIRVVKSFNGTTKTLYKDNTRDL